MKKKIITAILGFVCAASSTACTFTFDDMPSPSESENSSSLALNINTIAETIDNTDLTNESEVASLADDIISWSDGIDGTFQAAHLERVVDGDTIVVDIDGESYKVRLIGINTPESVASEEYLERTGKENTEAGKAASEYTKAVLENVDTVFLQMDVSDTDRYDRLLRYVWVELPNDCNDKYEIETKMLNAMLVKDGIADVEIYEPDDLYAETFKQIEMER